MTLNSLFFHLQKRKRKQRDLNTGELDAHIYHGKVTCFVYSLNTPCQQNLKIICTDFYCIFITMSSFGTNSTDLILILGTLFFVTNWIKFGNLVSLLYILQDFFRMLSNIFS